MIGYKATDMNGCCRGFKFEVGKTYTKDTPKEELECCTDKVFHFCRELFAIEKESEYKLSESRLFEVIAGDYVKSGDVITLDKDSDLVKGVGVLNNFNFVFPKISNSYSTRTNTLWVSGCSCEVTMQYRLIRMVTV